MRLPASTPNIVIKSYKNLRIFLEKKAVLKMKIIMRCLCFFAGFSLIEQFVLITMYIIYCIVFFSENVSNTLSYYCNRLRRPFLFFVFILIGFLSSCHNCMKSSQNFYCCQYRPKQQQKSIKCWSNAHLLISK